MFAIHTVKSLINRKIVNDVRLVEILITFHLNDNSILILLQVNTSCIQIWTWSQ